MRFRWFTIIFIAVLLGSCCRQTDLELGNAITAWAPYAQQQEITFANASGQTIKFIANQRQYNQSGEDKVCGSYDIETLETVLTPLSTSDFKIQITLSHEVLISFEVFSTVPTASNISIQFNTISEQYVSDPWRDRYFKEMELNGLKYQNVLHVFGDAINHNLAFAEVYYAKEQGLVAFKTFAGDWYYLQ